MRRTTALMSQLRLQPRTGAELYFEQAAGGYFSVLPEYGLRVTGHTLAPPPSKVVATLSDIHNVRQWVSGAHSGVAESSNVLSALQPNQTYTISFDAYCSHAGGSAAGDISCNECHPQFGTMFAVLGFALVPKDISADQPYNIDFPDGTIPLCVEYAIQSGERQSFSVTFVAPPDLTKYTLQAVTNQYVYVHTHGGETWPEPAHSTVTFTDIAISQKFDFSCVRKNTRIICALNSIAVPCDLYEDDVWCPATGVVERHTGFKTLDETVAVTQISSGTFRVENALPNCKYAADCYICSDSQYSSQVSGTNNQFDNTAFDSFDKVCWLSSTPSNKYLYFKDTSYADVTEFKKSLCGITVAYPLETATVEYYIPQKLSAPAGNVAVTQEAVDLPATLNASLLTKNLISSNKGWSWKDIQATVRLGLASQFFAIGDQLTVMRNGKPVIFDVIGINHDTPADSALKYSLTLQTHDCITDWVAFDTRQALYYAEDGLNAGYYHFTIPAGHDEAHGGGKTYEFCLTSPVPAGGILMFPWGYNQMANDVLIASYRSNLASDNDCIEAVSVTEGNAGTNLGTADGLDPNGHINRIEYARYGSNKWSSSDIRQFLNCDISRGEKWSPTTPFSRPPKWSSEGTSFLSGLDTSFTDVLGQVYKSTAVFVPSDSGPDEVAYQHIEKVFLPSCSEVYCGQPYPHATEGPPYAYYKNMSSLSSPSTSADTNRVKTLDGKGRSWWLRTANLYGVYNAGTINSTGARQYMSASTSCCVSPVCCIV